MANRTPPDPIRSADWLAELFRQARLIWRLWRDRRVPFLTKLVPPAILLYLFWPLDMLPDPLLGLGQLDDLAVILLGLRLFVALAPAEVVREHLSEMAGRWRVESPPTQRPSSSPETIEGQYRVIDKE
jgi:uncharacterized membrane protein YkvA (DUF1232 family)